MIRTGKSTTRWRLVVEGADTDPDNLSYIDRREIMVAIEQGENEGSITSDVMYSDVGEGTDPASLRAAGIEPDPEHLAALGVS